MATYTAPTTRTTGALISASIWNTDIVENLKYFKDAPVFDGDVSVGDDLLLPSTGAVINFASGDVTITHSTNTLTFAGASSGYVFDADLKLTVGEYIDWGTTVGSFGGRFGRYITGSFLLGVPGTSASESCLVVDSAGATIAEFRGDKTVSLTGNVAIGATAKLYFDGVAGTGDTYAVESAANTLDLVAGARTAVRAQKTDISVGTSATTILSSANPEGCLVVVTARDASTRFCDLVLASQDLAPTVVASYASLGSPAARTYTRSGAALQLAMASGTYTVNVLVLGI